MGLMKFKLLVFYKNQFLKVLNYFFIISQQPSLLNKLQQLYHSLNRPGSRINFLYNFSQSSKMDEQKKAANVFCKKCCNYIRAKNFQVHKERCLGSPYLKERVAYKQLDNKRNSRFNHKQQSSTTQPEEQTIPCHFCGYPQSLSELDTHPRRCEYKQQECKGCKQKFPKPLMDQHALLCSKLKEYQHQLSQQRQELKQRQKQRLRERERERQRQRQMQRERERESNHFNQFRFNQFPVFSRNYRSPMEMNMMGPRRSQMPNRNNFRSSNQTLFLLDSLTNLIGLLASSEMEQMGQQNCGLKKEEMDKFTVNKYSEKQNSKETIQGEQDLCVICYCNFKKEDNYMTLLCHHIFHPECIQVWLSKNPTCPVCKKDYSQPKKSEKHEEERDYQQSRPFPDLGRML